ncbi:MAG TPA: DUF4097 family beta strand repeat-containing protein [Gemmatimonadaceae bacterium]|nr:DUF4097 family beta strand repeat-containing protein [Gemmatimonadaceae bacterium]
MKTPWMFCGAVAVMSATVGIDNAGAQDDRYRERIDTTVTLDRGGSLNLSVYSGHVNVTGVPGTKMRVKGVVDRGELRFDAHSTSVRMQVEPDGRHGGAAELEISVPVGTRVQIDGYSAPYTVKGVKGEVKLESMSGSIEVSDAVGRTQLESISGYIKADNIDGDLRVESVSGRVDVSNVNGDIEAESVSGHVWITGAKSKGVRAETVSSSISYAGSIDPSGAYSFKSNSGRITLAVSANIGATVSLETFSGNVDSDFPVTLGAGTNSTGRDSRFEFKIGNGGARIILESFSGNIRIQRDTGRDNKE